MENLENFPQTNHLKSSIISSFSVFGKDVDDSAFPDGCEYVEAYAFMHQTLSGTATSDRSAVELLSELFEKGREDIIATAICKRFPHKKVAAIATFIPELSAGALNDVHVKTATNALKGLISAARILKKQGHPIQTIELVAGSRVQGILKRKSSEPHFFIQRQYPSRALSDLVERLSPIAKFAAEGSPVYLSVELEPGPLFILSQWSMLQAFCNLIDHSDDLALQQHVGLNLDIPHWGFLAGIDPEWLLSRENIFVFNRIAHAHVSDHHVGHFSDVSIPTYPGHEVEFFKWFSILHKLCVKKADAKHPKFSGFVSCEMEACKEPGMLLDCHKNVDEFIALSAKRPWEFCNPQSLFQFDRKKNSAQPERQSITSSISNLPQVGPQSPAEGARLTL